VKPLAAGVLQSPSFRRLIGLLRPHRGAIAGAMVLMAVSGLATGALAYYIKPVLDHIFIDRQARMLLWLPAGVVLIYAVKGLADYFQAVVLARIEEQILRQLREALFEHTLRLPLRQILQQSHGATLSRMSLDLTLLQQGLTVLARFFLSAFQILALIGVVLYMSWQLALISLATLPLAFYPLIRFGQKLRQRGRHQQVQMGEILDQFSQSLRGIEVIKTSAAEPFAIRQFHTLAQHYYRLMMQMVRIQKASVPVMEMIAALGIAAIIYLGGSEVVRGAMSAGAFFSFLAALGMIYEPLRQLSSANNQLQQGLSAADRLFAWLDQGLEESADAGQTPPISWGHWQCRQLQLRLGDEWVLRDLDVDIVPGQTVALLGPSGSGKTSFVRVLLGLIPPTGGSIRVGERSLEQLSLSAYRRCFAFVPQEPVLFSGTALENIAFGDFQPDRARAERAARAAHAWDFLEGQGGLEAVIEGQGSNLSGGQRQRLAIARALYLERPVLVLDEATSNLDAESEERIAETLEALHGQKTIVIVAHRPRTTRLADQRIYLEAGWRREHPSGGS